MSGRMQTHRLGVMCQVCEQELVDDLCSCGVRHGHGFQQPSEWAAEHWPDHPCFKETPRLSEAKPA